MDRGDAAAETLPADAPSTVQVNPSAVTAEPQADPVGLDELAVMLAELAQLDLEGAVPDAAFDPRWAEVDRS